MLTFIKPIKTIYLFSALEGLNITLAFLIKHLLINKTLYYQSFSDQLSIDQINRMLDMQSKYEYWAYLLLFIFNLIKYSIIALIIQTGIFLWGFKISYSQLFRVVIVAEFIFLFPLIIKLVWFYFVETNYTLEELQQFYPLSILNVFYVKQISQLWFYPLQLLNVFELLYWFILALGISKVIKKDFDKSLRIVLSSYLPALFIWVIFILFITLTLSPAYT